MVKQEIKDLIDSIIPMDSAVTVNQVLALADARSKYLSDRDGSGHWTTYAEVDDPKFIQWIGQSISELAPIATQVRDAQQAEASSRIREIEYQQQLLAWKGLAQRTRDELAKCVNGEHGQANLDELDSIAAELNRVRT